MLQTLKKILSKFIITVVALQILNLGLYAQDFEVVPTAAGTDQNIINSVTEYVAEVVMEQKDAFPEKKELPNQSHESHEQQLIKFQPFKFINSPHTTEQEVELEVAVLYNQYTASSYDSINTEIIAPPPKC